MKRQSEIDASGYQKLRFAFEFTGTSHECVQSLKPFPLTGGKRNETLEGENAKMFGLTLYAGGKRNETLEGENAKMFGLTRMALEDNLDFL